MKNPAQLSVESPALLQVENISAGYGKLDVLQNVSLRVQRGEVVAIIGPNGAGKSTVLKTVMGMLKPSQGRVQFDAQDITAQRTDQLVLRGLGYVPQGRVVFPKMSVLENLEMGAFTVRDPRAIAARTAEVFALFPRLAERTRQIAGTMSGGEQQMLSIARALMTRPQMILLDEPSLGLAPKFVDMVFDQIVALKETGITLAIVEQNAARALEIATRGYVLELGRNKYQDSGQALLNDERVRKMYLGG